MPAYTLSQLRETAPAEFKDLDDEALVREYARVQQVPFEQAADYYGVRPRGTLGEMGRQFAGGLTVDVPRMGGQALKAFGVAPELGQELVRGAEERAYQYEPDRRAQRGLVGEAFVAGARGVPAVAPLIASAFLPGGQVVAPALGAGLFGGSSYQDTYEKLIEQGVPEEQARAAAIRVGGLQGVGEGVATAALGPLFRPAAAALRGTTTTAGIAKAATDARVLAPVARGLALNVPLQAGTEAAQDVGTELIERSYGAAPEDIGEIARQSALGGAGLTLLLGPLAVGASASRSRRAKQLNDALYGENTPDEVREQARAQVAQLARDQGIAESDVQGWLDRQLREEQASTRYLQREEQRTLQTAETLAEQEPVFADIVYALRDPELSKVISEQDRSTLFSAISTLQAPNLTPAARQQTIDDTNSIIASYLTQDGLDAAQDLTTDDRAPALFRAPTVTETPVGDMVQVSTNFPVDMTSDQAPTGLGRAVRPAPAPVPGLPGVREVSPGVFEADEPLVQVETRPQPAAAPAQGVSPRGGEAALTPAVTTAAGVSLPPATPAPTTSAPAAPAPAAPATTAPAAPPAKRGRPKKVAAPAAVAPTAPTPAAPPAAPFPANQPAANQPAATEAELEADEAQTAQAQKVIDDLGLRPLAEGGQKNLQASVTGGNIAVSGRASLPAKVLASAKNMFLRGGRESKSQAGQLAAAARKFGEEYLKYLNTGSNMVPSASRTILKPTTKFPARDTAAQAEARTEAPVAKARAQLLAAQAALSELGVAAGNNAKNVEALIRLVKNEIGARKMQINEQLGMDIDGEAAVELEQELRGLEQLDAGLSQGWAAAKRGILRTDASLLDVRGGDVRTSREEQEAGFEQPLVRAATYGAAVGKASKQQTGLQGVLNYIRSSGTPFERMIAKAVSEVFKNTKNPPALVFDDNATPGFDPANNTVTMSPTASPEVALHEALHAALQWFVHSNPKNPMVVSLLKAVDKVVKYDTAKLSEKAAAVQKVLADLKADKRDLDAVLELVSYGNTLVEFRKALEAMPTKGTPTSFVQAASDVWNMILATVRRMLGVPQSVASDVIMDSFKLLEEASRAEYTAQPKGQALRADVQSNPTLAQRAQTVQAALEQTRTEQAKEAGFDSYSTYKDRPSSSFNITRMVFEQLGFGKGGKVQSAVQKAAAKSADIIRKEFPALDFVILNLNSRFGQSPTYGRIADFFKQDAQTGLLEAEYMAQYLYRNPQDAERVFRYLDGDATVLKEDGRDATLRRMGDNILRHINDYISTLPAQEQKLFADMKFTDYAISPTSIAQLAGKSLGIKGLSKKLVTESRNETSLDAFKQYLPFENGVLDTDVPLYQIFETVPDGQGNMVRVPFGFIGKAQAEANQGLDIDRSRVWFLDKAVEADGEGPFTFKTRAASPTDLRDISGKLARGEYTPAQREDAVQQLSAALLNTMAVLSNNYAYTNMFRGLAAMERNADGTPTERSVAFDSVDQINELFKGRKITEANVLDAPSDEAKTTALRADTQRAGTWVRLPDTDTYGALRGKLIPGPVWNNLQDMSDRSPLLNSQLLSDIMTTFKKSKTVLTPATHVNNILTNYALMLLHGIPHKALQDAAQLMYRYEVSPKSLTKPQLALMQEFYRSGAVLGQFTNTEAKNFITRKLAENITPENDKSLVQKLASWGKFESEFEQYAAQLARGAKLTDNVLTELYAAGDNVFRLAAFMNVAGNIQATSGDKQLSDAQIREAGLAARKMFLDYDIDARWVRTARQSVLPFVSWAYAITPVLGRLAIEKPWTMVNMMAALGIMAALTDGDDDWREKGPEQVREKFLGVVPQYFRVPFLGSDEAPVYYNLGKSVPFMSLFQPAMGQSKLFGQEWIPSAVTPGGPYTALIASTLFGIDAFTGKPLSDVTQTQAEKFASSLESVYNTMAPSVASTRLWGPNEGEIAKLLENRKGPTGAEPDAMFLARLFGFTAYEFNRSEVQFYQDAQVKKLKREFSLVMNKAKRDEYAKGYPDYEALDAKLADLRTRLEERINEIRGEE